MIAVAAAAPRAEALRAGPAVNVGIVSKWFNRGQPVVGRYLLSGSIFGRLHKVGRGAGGETQLTDGIAALLADEPVYAYRFNGKRYDCGSKLGYLEATVEYGLRHPELGTGFAAYLESLMRSGRVRP